MQANKSKCENSKRIPKESRFEPPSTSSQCSKWSPWAEEQILRRTVGSGHNHSSKLKEDREDPLQNNRITWKQQCHWSFLCARPLVNLLQPSHSSSPNEKYLLRKLQRWRNLDMNIRWYAHQAFGFVYCKMSGHDFVMSTTYYCFQSLTVWQRSRFLDIWCFGGSQKEF